ncbi:conserved Plasmodium protein, unknown function [Plasmodium malariae]|uniref:Uncharacterized protein n=1 Tax=Plasmodium malariae TaxID=5858 RepID=A0A1C3L0T9_PLAMA|nr:conserved Plasmodium protein, unknown function [Plasmodium malariae]
MGSNSVSELINEYMGCEDTHKESKIKIANNLVKNFCLLKELNLLTTIKNEEKSQVLDITNNKDNNIITYDSNNIIYANKYIMDFLQIKEQNEIKINEEKQRKKKKKCYEEEILNEKDILSIINTLNINELNLSMYEKNITYCDELNSFKVFNSHLLVKYIDKIATTEKDKRAHLKYYEIFNLLIKNYNNTLNLIKTQQRVINDLIFYAHNILINNKMLIEKNKNLIKMNSANIELKNKLYDNNAVQIKLPFTGGEELSSLYQIQIDLYRKHINHLYNENDELRKNMSMFNAGSRASNF